MKFSAVFLALTMAAASVQALSYQSADSDLASRSNSAYDDIHYARSDALLEFTTRELVEELETRMTLVQRGNHPYVTVLKNKFHAVTGNRFNKQGSGQHGSSHSSASAPPTGGATDPNALGGGSTGGAPGTTTPGSTGGSPGMGGDNMGAGGGGGTTGM